MLKFKSYIVEARLAPLYHGTSMRRINSIINDGFIADKTEHMNKDLLQTPKDKTTKGVSLSRSLAFSKHYNGQIVFEFDQKKLTQKFKIIPINYFGSSYGVARMNSQQKVEAEEFVLGKIPLSFVTKIFVSKLIFSRPKPIDSEEIKKDNISREDWYKTIEWFHNKIYQLDLSEEQLNKIVDFFYNNPKVILY